MKILLTQTVEKELIKTFSSQKSVDFFIKKIKENNQDTIYIQRPFVKIKVGVFWLSLRVVWEYRKVWGQLVIILIIKKSDKRYWNNLLWSKEIKQKVCWTLWKIAKDISLNNYKIY